MALQSGDRLGPYAIQTLLGVGGMGEVYRGRDTRLGRDVALKVISPRLVGDPTRRRRFELEARAASVLNHPSIVTVYDVGDAEGIPWIAMEWVEGQTLRHALGTGPLPVHETLKIALQIADGLATAHAKGIVHRDLKPGNVMITAEGRSKILDFGLARQTPGEGLASPMSEADTLACPSGEATREGVILGTVGYMSPEQASGRPVDFRSDQFAFGLIVYEMLTGRPAFDSPTPVETLAAIVRDEPVPASSLRAGIPPPLQRLIATCLAKRPEDRFASTRELAEALEALARGSSAAGTPTGTDIGSGPVSPALPSRRKLAMSVTVAGLVLGLGGLWLVRLGNRAATPTYSSASGPKRIAVLPFENLGAAEDAYFADGMTDEVRSKLAALPDLTVIASASASQYRATTKPPEQIATELGVGYLLVAKVRWQKSGQTRRIRLTSELVEVGGGGAPTTRWQEAFEADASDVFRVQGEIAIKVARSLEVALSAKERGPLTARPTSNLAAYDAYLKGQEINQRGHDPATQRRAAAQYEQAVALDPGFAMAWSRLSVSRSLTYRGAPSPREAEAARAAADRAIELAPSMPQGHRALGDYYRFVEKDPERAIEAYARGLNLAPDDALLLQALAGTERIQERWEEALAHLRRARELDPRSWEVERQLANTLLFLRRAGEMRVACDRGLVLAPANLNLIELKAITFLQEGDLPGARAVLEAAPKEVERTALVAYLATYGNLHWLLDDAQRDLLLRLTPGAFDGDRGVWASVLAQVAALRGDKAKAREYAEEARQALASQVAAVPQDGQRRVFLGLALAHLGRKADAIREGERGVALSPNSKYLQHQLARIHILVGNHERALDLLEPLLKVPYSLTPGWLRIDPNFDPLRGNPRFDALAPGP